MVTLLIILAVLALLGLAWWFCWDEGIGPVGYLKREIRFEQARRRADDIAWDAQQRINRLG